MSGFEDLLEVTVEVEEGFVDLDLPLTAVGTGTGGGLRVDARGHYRGQPIGFSVEFEPGWDPRPIEGTNDFFYCGSVILRATGNESAHLLRVLDELYGTSIPTGKMLDEMRVTAVGLGDDPSFLLQKPIHTKLFFDHDDEERYAEVFLNIDVGASRVGLHEKDSDYRRPLLLALGGDAG